MRTTFIVAALGALALASPAQAGWSCEATLRPGASAAETRAFVRFDDARNILSTDSGVMWVPAVSDPQDGLGVRFRYGVDVSGRRSTAPDRFVVSAYVPYKIPGLRLQLHADGAVIHDAPLPQSLIASRTVAFDAHAPEAAQVLARAAAARELDVRLNAPNGHTMAATSVNLAPRAARETDADAALAAALAELQTPNACVRTYEDAPPPAPEGPPAPVPVAPASTWSGPSGGH